MLANTAATRLLLLLSLGLAAGGCRSEEFDAVYLSVRLDGDATPPTSLVARAMTHTAEGTRLAQTVQALEGLNLRNRAWVLRIEAPAGSPYAAEAVLSVVALHATTPVASWAARVDLTHHRTVEVALQPIVLACDLDGDGFENCLAQAGCCNAVEAELAHDCDDRTPLVQPFAEREACRTCTAEGGPLPGCTAGGPEQDGGLDGPDMGRGADGGGCTPACPVGRCDRPDGCGGTCGCSDGLRCNSGWCVVPGMTRVPGDSFWMGCNAVLQDPCPPEQLPQRLVEVAAFDIDTVEVSNQAYRECVQAGTCAAPSYDDGSCFIIDPVSNTWTALPVPGLETLALREPLHPVMCINWEQARTYCEQWRGPGCRLCTEAEFEVAARGSCVLYEGDDCRSAMPPWPWGTTDPRQQDVLGRDPGNYADATAQAKYPFLEGIPGYTDGYAETSPVGQFPDGQSKYGVRDLSGNVWEWVQDCWHETYAGAPLDGRSWEEPDCPKRVRRGGSWINNDLAALGAGSRAAYDPDFKVDIVGFRCCRSLP